MLQWLRFASLLLCFTAVIPKASSATGVTQYQLKHKGTVQITVPTSVGIIKGQMQIKKLELRGPKGWNPFKFRLVLDASSFSSGDALRDKYVVERMLKPSQGDFYLFSLERIAPPWGEDGQPVGDARIKGFMDPVRKGAYVELPYRWDGDREGGVLTVEHEMSLKSLGLPAPEHPFVQVTGPLKISILADLARVSSAR